MINKAPQVLLDRIAGDSKERLKKYLWVELLINPEMTARLTDKEIRKYEDHLRRSALWRTSYRGYLDSIGGKNSPLDKLIESGTIKPMLSDLSRKEYNQHIREFLKGLEVLWSKK
jgi:hypothetical protein